MTCSNCGRVVLVCGGRWADHLDRARRILAQMEAA